MLKVNKEERREEDDAEKDELDERFDLRSVHSGDGDDFLPHNNTNCERSDYLVSFPAYLFSCFR